MRSSRAAILALFALSPLAGVCAQGTGCTTRTIPIAVRDALGNPIRGLAPSDFEAKLHGKPASVISVQPDLRLHRMVILLDTSGSMGTNDYPSHRWNLAIMLALHAAESAGPRTKLALLLFAEKVNEVDDFSKGNAAIIARLTQIASDRTFVKKEIRGRTALFDSMAKAFQLIDRPSSADLLYAITDGGDNQSHLHSDAVRRLLDPNMVRVFVALLQSEEGYRSLTPEEISGSEDLSKLVRGTGGVSLDAITDQQGKGWYAFQSPDRNATMQQVLVRFYRSMLENDLVTIQVPTSINKREKLQLKLSEVDRKKWKDAEVLYPSEVEPCALPPPPRKAE